MQKKVLIQGVISSFKLPSLFRVRYSREIASQKPTSGLSAARCDGHLFVFIMICFSAALSCLPLQFSTFCLSLATVCRLRLLFQPLNTRLGYTQGSLPYLYFSMALHVDDMVKFQKNFGIFISRLNLFSDSQLERPLLGCHTGMSKRTLEFFPL